MPTLAGSLFSHHVWATDRLIEFCAGLDDDRLSADAPTAYGSNRQTLAHLVGSEAYYVFALTGRWLDPPLDDDAIPAIHELRDRARRTGEALIDIAGETEPDAVVNLPRRGEERSLQVAAV